MIFEDPKFWVAVSFVGFVALTFKPIKRALLSALDNRVAKIKRELEEAIKLKEDAEKALSYYQNNMKRAEDEVAKIMEHAKREAEQITENARHELEESLKKRTQIAEQRIVQAEAAALKDIRDNAIDITISAARSLIIENMGREVAEEIVRSAIADMGRKFH